MKTIIAKLGTMRKAQSFSVLPCSDGKIMIQSSKSIGRFDPATGEGVLNIKGCYFMHLNSCLGAKPYVFPTDIVAEATGILQ